MSEVTAEMIERGRGPDVAVLARRRKTASKVREVRERLTSSGTGHRAFDIELLRIYAQRRLDVALALGFLGIVIATLASTWMTGRDILIWITLLFTSLVVDHRLAQNVLLIPDAEINLNGWRRKFTLASALQGATWALIVAFLAPVEDPGARTFVLYVLLLVAALSAMEAATMPLSVWAALAPITLGIILYLKPVHEVSTLPLALLTAGAPMYFILLARRLYATSLATLVFRAEKDLLIAELEQSKSMSDDARRRAEEASLAKSRFLATMSHELRTPLNAILGFSEVMKTEMFGVHATPAYKDYSQDIHSSGEHLLMLINEILDLSRVEAGRYELKEEPVSLAHVVEDCRHLLALRAKKRDITITDAIEADLPRVWCDERAIRQVTLNLLSNAIKFTPQGGAVAIKVGWTARGGQYVSIRDTGPGIPEHEIPVVLSSFGRGSLAQKNADEGSGLGLPIVKGLIELHGGTFTLDSRVREGTEVIVTLPPQRVIDGLPQMLQEKPPRTLRRFNRLARPAA